MKDIIKIQKLNFKYEDKEIFKNLDLVIKKNSFTTILGASGSGKTTLTKLLLGLEKGNSVIMLNNLPIIKENLNRIYSEVSVVFENPDQTFVAQTVTDELAFALENLNYSKEKIKKQIEKISTLLDIKKILDQETHTLNANDKSLVALAAALMTNPKVLIIDEGLNNLNASVKHKVLIMLKEMTKKDLTVLYLTHDSNDSLYGDNLIILENKKVLISDIKENVYKNEKLFKQAHLELPFIIDLSKKLQFYNLIDNDYQDAEKLVEQLWK